MTRHGLTAGNLVHRYSGSGTDEPLCDEGFEKLKSAPHHEGVPFVYTSGMTRTEQTAAELYPDAKTIAVQELREMNFGIFEGKNYLDLADSEQYRTWVDTECRDQCPEGESRAQFIERTLKAFLSILEQEGEKGSEEVHFVVHGGTVMVVLSELGNPKREYFSINPPQGMPWIFDWNGTELVILESPEKAGIC